jgi:hypothetical protein
LQSAELPLPSQAMQLRPHKRQSQPAIQVRWVPGFKAYSISA